MQLSMSNSINCKEKSYRQGILFYKIATGLLAVFIFVSFRKMAKVADVLFALSLLFSFVGMIRVGGAREWISTKFRKQMIFVYTFLLIPYVALIIQPKDNLYKLSLIWMIIGLVYLLSCLGFWLFVGKRNGVADFRSEILSFFAKYWYLIGLLIAVVITSLGIFNNYLVEDTRAYSLDMLECLRNFSFEPGIYKNFRPCYHIDYGFALVYTPLAVLFKTHSIGLRITNILVWCTCIVLFYKIIKGLYSNISEILACGMTTIFAFMPLLYGPLYDVDLELTGVLFVLALIWAFVYKQHVLELFFGLMLVFTKENAIAIAVAFFGGTVLYYIIAGKKFKETGEKYKNYRKTIFSLFMAILCYCAFFVGNEGLAWSGVSRFSFITEFFDELRGYNTPDRPYNVQEERYYTDEELLEMGFPPEEIEKFNEALIKNAVITASSAVSDAGLDLLVSDEAESVLVNDIPEIGSVEQYYDYEFVPRVDSLEAARITEEKKFNRVGLNWFVILSKLKQALVLNFAWIGTIIVAFGIAVLAYRKKLNDFDWGVGLPIIGAAGGFFVAQAAVITYCSPRYMKLAPVFLMLAVTGVLYKLGIKTKLVAIGTVLITVLLMAQNYYSVDPVSNWLFDRIDMGNAKMVLDTPTYDLANCGVLRTSKDGKRYLYASAQTSRQFASFEEMMEMCYAAVDYKEGDMFVLPDFDLNYVLSFYYGNSTEYTNYNRKTKQFEDNFTSVTNNEDDDNLVPLTSVSFVSHQGLDYGYQGKDEWENVQGDVYYVSFAFSKDIDERILKEYDNEYITGLSHKGWIADIYRLEK